MKLVLCGNREDFDYFVQVLWRRDKDISDYRYISNLNDIRGFSPLGNIIVKLGSFQNH